MFSVPGGFLSWLLLSPSFLLQKPVTTESRGLWSQPLISPKARPLPAVPGLWLPRSTALPPPSTSMPKSPLTGQTEASEVQPGRQWQPGGVPDSDLLGPSERKGTVTTLSISQDSDVLPEERPCLWRGRREAGPELRKSAGSEQASPPSAQGNTRLPAGGRDQAQPSYYPPARAAGTVLSAAWRFAHLLFTVGSRCRYCTASKDPRIWRSARYQLCGLGLVILPL